MFPRRQHGRYGAYGQSSRLEVATLVVDLGIGMFMPGIVGWIHSRCVQRFGVVVGMDRDVIYVEGSRRARRRLRQWHVNC